MALSRSVVKGSFLSQSEDLVKKSILLSREDARILRILRIFSGLQINQNATVSSPHAVTAKKLIKELSPNDRCQLLDRVSAKSVPYGKSVKPLIVRLIADTFTEDGSLWLGDPHIGGLLTAEISSLSTHCRRLKVLQPTSEQFAEPIMTAALCNFDEGHQPSSDHIAAVIRFANNAMTLTPRFVALTRFLERHIGSRQLDNLAPADNFRFLQYITRTTLVHPDPDVELLKILVARLPDTMQYMVERSQSFTHCEAIRSAVALRIRHTPSVNALSEQVLSMPIVSLPLLTTTLAVHAAFHMRNVALEDAALGYVRRRRAHHLMTNPVTMHELAWSMLVLRGEVPDEVVPYATSSVLRYVRDDIVQMEALPFLEQTADLLPLEPEQRLAFEGILHATSLTAERRSRAAVAPLGTADPNVLLDVAVGPLFAHAVALVAPDGDRTLPWPADLAPEQLTAETAARLSGTPVALMVIPETQRRRLRPHLLMAVAGVKRRQLEARGWTVAVVSHGALSLRDAWFPEGSAEVYPIDDAAVLRRAMLSARSEQVGEEGLERDDSFSYSGDADLGSYETYGQDYLTVLFSRDLGVASPIDRRQRPTGKRRATDLLLESAV